MIFSPPKMLQAVKSQNTREAIFYLHPAWEFTFIWMDLQWGFMTASNMSAAHYGIGSQGREKLSSAARSFQANKYSKGHWIVLSRNGGI